MGPCIPCYFQGYQLSFVVFQGCLALISPFGLGDSGKESLNTRLKKFSGSTGVSSPWIWMFRRTISIDDEWGLDAEENLPRYNSCLGVLDCRPHAMRKFAVYTKRESTTVGPRVLSTDDYWWSKNRWIHTLWRPRCTRSFLTMCLLTPRKIRR